MTLQRLGLYCVLLGPELRQSSGRPAGWIRSCVEETMSRRRSLFIAAGAAGLLMLTFTVAWAAGTLSPKEQLGKAIFFDQNLSLNRNLACASCHGAAVGFTGPDSLINLHGAVYEGSIAGAFGNRKPPSSAYTTMSPILHVDQKGAWVGGNFWDGRATGAQLGSAAADQDQRPFLNPKERARTSRATAAAAPRARRTWPAGGTCLTGTTAAGATSRVRGSPEGSSGL